MTDIRFYDGLNTPPYEVIVAAQTMHANDEPKIFDWVEAEFLNLKQGEKND